MIRLEGSDIVFSFDPPDPPARRRMRRHPRRDGSTWISKSEPQRKREQDERGFRRWLRRGKPPAWNIEPYTKL